MTVGAARGVGAKGFPVYVGGDVVVAVDEIVAILDGRTVAGSEINQELIRRAPRLGRTVRPGMAPPRGGRGGAASWVVTTGGIAPSGISAATLARRMAHFGTHVDS